MSNDHTQFNYTHTIDAPESLITLVQRQDLARIQQRQLTMEDLDQRDNRNCSVFEYLAVSPNQAIYDYFYHKVVLTAHCHMATADSDASPDARSNANPAASYNTNFNVHRDPKPDALGRTRIHWAAKCNQPQSVFSDLVHAGENINANYPPYHVTPLYIATQSNCENAVLALLALGADPNVPAVTGATPLHVAAQTGRVSLIDLLIKHGADVNATCQQGNTPLMVAQRFKQTGAIQRLTATTAQAVLAETDLETL